MWSYSSVSSLIYFDSFNSRGHESLAQRRMREQDERALRAAMDSFRESIVASDALRASFEMAKPPMWWLRGDRLVPQIVGGNVSLRPRSVLGRRSLRARRWKRWGKHVEAAGLVPRNAG